MGWKRKSSSPELQPNPAKAPKRESISRSPFSLKLSPSSWRRKVSTPTKTKSIQTPVQSNCQEQNSSPGNVEISSIPWGKLIAELNICGVFFCVWADHGEDDTDSVQDSTPVSSPLQSEVDAELGLVITVGESAHLALLTTLDFVMLLVKSIITIVFRSLPKSEWSLIACQSLDEDRCEGEEWLKKRNRLNLKKSGMTLVEGEFPEKNGEMDTSSEELDEEDESEEELRKLDRDLTLKSKKLKLSSVNVRNIIHVSLT